MGRSGRARSPRQRQTRCGCLQILQQVGHPRERSSSLAQRCRRVDQHDRAKRRVTIGDPPHRLSAQVLGGHGTASYRCGDVDQRQVEQTAVAGRSAGVAHVESDVCCANEGIGQGSGIAEQHLV